MVCNFPREFSLDIIIPVLRNHTDENKMTTLSTEGGNILYCRSVIKIVINYNISQCFVERRTSAALKPIRNY